MYAVQTNNTKRLNITKGIFKNTDFFFCIALLINFGKLNNIKIESIKMERYSEMQSKIFVSNSKLLLIAKALSTRMVASVAEFVKNRVKPIKRYAYTTNVYNILKNIGLGLFKNIFSSTIPIAKNKAATSLFKENPYQNVENIEEATTAKTRARKPFLFPPKFM